MRANVVAMDTSLQVGETGGRVSITCEEVLDLSTAEGLRARLLGAVARGAEVELLASGVERIDTASLQLLCAAARELTARGRSLRVMDASPTFLQAARRLGLAAALGLGALSPIDPPNPRDTTTLDH